MYIKHSAKRANHTYSIQNKLNIIVRGLFGGINSGDDSALESFLQMISLISERKNVKVNIYVYFPGRGKVVKAFLKVYGAKKAISVIPISGKLQLIYNIVRKRPNIYVVCGGQKHGVLSLLDSMLTLLVKIFNPRVKILYLGIGYSYSNVAKILKDQRITPQHYFSRGISTKLKFALVLLSLLGTKMYIRDKLTYLLFRYSGFQRIKLIKDIVFYLGISYSNPKQLNIESSRPYIVITPRNLLDEDLNNKQVIRLVEIMKRYTKVYPYARMLLLVTSPEDLEVVATLLSSIKNIRARIPLTVLFAYNYLPSSVIYTLNTIQIIEAIALRLHAALFLYRAQCNNITLVGYDYKALEYSRLHRINLVTIRSF